MTWLEAIAVVAAGLAAGGVNAVVGSGSLITFPTLLAVGFPPVTANVSNNIGLVPGSVTGVLGFRRELVGQGRRARTLAMGSGSGALVGATLLLTLPSDVFDTIVPLLVLLACVLMVLQPRLSKLVAERQAVRTRDVGPAPLAVAFVAGIYGGYFGAAQGVILLAALAVLVPDDLGRTNALKNVLAGTVNALAAVLFIAFADVAWNAVGLIALGAVVGGAVGARVGRRIPANVLRFLVVALGVGVAIQLLVT
ncbi:MAG: sulfite exporter TauE/SafE family protein [Acidimicrobiia bacterium]|nr:sulfite exporter TauE/SafE family protein [Acidimicrobiia bacterium]